LGEAELQGIKEDIAEIKARMGDIAEVKDEVKKVSTGLADLRVLIAGDYVKREEFEEAKKENEGAHRALTGWIIGICTTLLGVFSYLIFRGGR
jgi:hypothetical protein